MGSHALQKADGQGNECRLCSKAIGAAGRGSRSAMTPCAPHRSPPRRGGNGQGGPDDKGSLRIRQPVPRRALAGRGAARGVARVERRGGCGARDLRRRRAQRNRARSRANGRRRTRSVHGEPLRVRRTRRLLARLRDGRRLRHAAHAERLRPRARGDALGRRGRGAATRSSATATVGSRTPAWKKGRSAS
jgi:hypothetical protein